MAAKKPTPAPSKYLIAQQVWQLYEEQKPRVGIDFDAWVATTAEKLGLEEVAVRRIVAKQTDIFNASLKRSLQTQAQDVAQHLGADITAALETLRDGLQAGVRKPLLDKSGRPLFKKDADGKDIGEALYWEAPNWDARLAAARTLIDIHGAKAPQQVQVDVNQDIHHHLHSENEAELIERLNGFILDIQTFQTGTTPEDRGSGGGSKRIDPPASNTGPLLLADGAHEDEGRTAVTGGRPL